MNWKVLIISFIIVFLVAGIGSLVTSPVTDTEWYEAIKPDITPPNYIFPIVWNILFILIALSLYFAWTNSGDKKNKQIVAWVFGINFILNILWSVLFFGMKNPFASFIEIIFLWVSILIMIIATYKISKLSSYLLVPYLLWVGFATYLNYLMVWG